MTQNKTFFSSLAVQIFKFPMIINEVICVIQGSGHQSYESAFCAMLDKNVPTGVPIYELSSLLFFLVPMMIIIILYILIGLQIRQSSRHSLGKQIQGGDTKQIQSKKSIVRMLGNYYNIFI